MAKEPSKYTARANDPIERERWRNSGLVRIDSLTHNDVFECISGTYWQYSRVTASGTIEATPWGHSGEPTTFIEAATVRPVMRKQHVS
jgi:hypothetical protein